LADYRYELLPNPDDELREAVYQGLREHNRTANPVYWAKVDQPESEPAALNVFALDGQGDAVGGLFGETTFSWLKISIMSVREEFRGQGIGTRLVLMAEAEAKRRGCKYAFADTMEYQAPEFYRKLGYRVAGRLDDWDSHGHAKFFFVKELL
jgi:GNAT superfamily N-acetyltransferase